MMHSGQTTRRVLHLGTRLCRSSTERIEACPSVVKAWEGVRFEEGRRTRLR
jgi:hypothetical protein